MNLLRVIKWLSTKEAKEKKWIDAAASVVIGVIIIGEAVISNNIWGTKAEPYVRLTLNYFINLAGLKAPGTDIHPSGLSLIFDLCLMDIGFKSPSCFLM